MYPCHTALTENVKHSQTERVKKSTNKFCKEHLRSSFIFWIFGINVTVGITGKKCGIPPKHLFQRTQQDGGYTQT